MQTRFAIVMTGISFTALATAVSGCTQAPPGYKLYGATMTIPQMQTVPADRVFADPAAYDGKKVRLAGNIDAVCAKRGCWLTLRQKEQILRARFVESGECTQGFFVPRDAGGHEAVLEGTVRVEEISEDLARHFLEDGGAPPEEVEKIVGPQKALAMVCTGVAIKGGDSLSEPVKAGE